MNWLWCIIGIAIIVIWKLIQEKIEEIKVRKVKRKPSQEFSQLLKKPQFLNSQSKPQQPNPEKNSKSSVSRQELISQLPASPQKRTSPQKPTNPHPKHTNKTPLKPFIEDPQIKIVNRIYPQKEQQMKSSIESLDHFNPIIQNFDELVRQKIFSLYNISCRSRGPSDQWAKFIGPIEKGSEFLDWYSDSNVKLKKQLSAVLSGYRRVRGDGNCYYTAVAFQYFQIILTKYSDLEFKQVIEEMQQMQLQIYYKNFYIEEALQNPCARILAELLQCLRFQPDGLYTMMSDPDQELYALSVIYIRNLANATYRKDSLIKTIIQPDLAEEVLTWECQCNNTEMLHSSLAKYLQIKINVYYVDKAKGELMRFAYGTSNDQIHLLFQPGHYEIGISF